MEAFFSVLRMLPEGLVPQISDRALVKGKRWRAPKELSVPSHIFLVRVWFLPRGSFSSGAGAGSQACPTPTDYHMVITWLSHRYKAFQIGSPLAYPKHLFASESYFPTSFFYRNTEIWHPYHPIVRTPLTKTIGEVKVTTKGQITIPAEVREYLKLTDGDYMIFKEEGGRLVVARAVLKEA